MYVCSRKKRTEMRATLNLLWELSRSDPCDPNTHTHARSHTRSHTARSACITHTNSFRITHEGTRTPARASHPVLTNRSLLRRLTLFGIWAIQNTYTHDVCHQIYDIVSKHWVTRKHKRKQFRAFVIRVRKSARAPRDWERVMGSVGWEIGKFVTLISKWKWWVAWFEIVWTV